MPMDNHGIPPAATNADDVPVDRVKNGVTNGYDDAAEMEVEQGFALGTNPKAPDKAPFGNLGSKGGRG